MSTTKRSDKSEQLFQAQMETWASALLIIPPFIPVQTFAGKGGTDQWLKAAFSVFLLTKRDAQNGTELRKRLQQVWAGRRRSRLLLSDSCSLAKFTFMCQTGRSSSAKCVFRTDEGFIDQGGLLGPTRPDKSTRGSEIAAERARSLQSRWQERPDAAETQPSR